MKNSNEKNQLKTHVVKTLDDSLSQEKFKHLDFELKPDDRLADIYNIKIKIIQDFLSFYKKYSTLHSFRIGYNENWQHHTHQGWTPTISQIAFDSVEIIKASTEYKNSNLDMNTFCSKYFKDKKDDCIIPLEGKKVSFNYVLNDLQKTFSYLNVNGLGKELKSVLHSQYPKVNSIHIDSRDTYGWVNIRIESDIKEFWGSDMLVALRHFELVDKLNEVSSPVNSVKTVKI